MLYKAQITALHYNISINTALHFIVANPDRTNVNPDPGFLDN
jgi:hypothetical protein